VGWGYGASGEKEEKLGVNYVLECRRCLGVAGKINNYE
jgi:hypothetical protein